MRVAHFRFPSLLESILIARTRSIEQSIESSRRAGRSQGEGMEAGARSLAEVYESEARLVGDLVRPETRMRGPRPRIEAIQDLGPRDHWVDFASPADEPGRAMAFVNQGLARGAKVVALLPSEDVEAYRERAVLEGHSKDLADGALALFSIDAQMDTLRSAGAAAVFILAVQGILHGLGAEDAPEMWVISKVTSGLLTRPPPRMDLALRVEAAWDLVLHPFPTCVYCPLPLGIPADNPFATDLVRRHAWAALGDRAIAVGSHSR